MTNESLRARLESLNRGPLPRRAQQTEDVTSAGPLPIGCRSASRKDQRTHRELLTATLPDRRPAAQRQVVQTPFGPHLQIDLPLERLWQEVPSFSPHGRSFCNHNWHWRPPRSNRRSSSTLNSRRLYRLCQTERSRSIWKRAAWPVRRSSSWVCCGRRRRAAGPVASRPRLQRKRRPCWRLSGESSPNMTYSSHSTANRSIGRDAGGLVAYTRARLMQEA